MAKVKTTKYDLVIRAAKKAPKAGLTAAQISERTSVNIGTVRSYLQFGTSTGAVFVIGKVSTGKRGRPALLYKG